MSERKDGFYWVLDEGFWEIGHYYDDFWYGLDDSTSDEEIQEIDEREVVRPENTAPVDSVDEDGWYWVLDSKGDWAPIKFSHGYWHLPVIGFGEQLRVVEIDGRRIVRS